MLRGSLTALVTPFDKGGRFDEKAFRAFVDWQIAEGTNGLVPVGTTGESPTLSHDEHRQVVKTCIDAAKGRVPVVAGAGSNNTEEAIGLVQVRRGGRRRRGAGRHALLQQADAARALRAFRGGGQGDDAACHHLQHPAALGDRHDAGDDGQAGARLQEHRRRQGRHRQGRARVRAAHDLRQGFHPAVRRGCQRARLQRAWRRRLHLGDGQRRAAALRGIPGGDAGQRQGEVAGAAGPADAAAQGDLHRARAGWARNMRCRGWARWKTSCVRR